MKTLARIQTRDRLIHEQRHVIARNGIFDRLLEAWIGGIERGGLDGMSGLVVEREGDVQVVAFFQMHVDVGGVCVDAGNTRRTAIDVAERGEELHTILLAEQGELVDVADVDLDVQGGN